MCNTHVAFVPGTQSVTESVQNSKKSQLVLHVAAVLFLHLVSMPHMFLLLKSYITKHEWRSHGAAEHCLDGSL